MVLSQVDGNAALVGQFQAYDGSNAQRLSFDDVLSRARRADIVLFGEEHSNVVCNQLQAQLFARLVRRPDMTALAMEFFETDTQVALDDYLAGRIDEKTFREKARQNRAYLTAHRPLIEFAKQAWAYVLAANAPRRLVSGLRKSGLPYDQYLATLDPADRAWLPATSTAVRDEYWQAFCKVMEGGHGESPPPSTQPAGGPASVPASEPASQPDPLTAEERLYRGFRSQCLWDDAMADSVAKVRANAASDLRVMLIVGSFHVAHHGGTKKKLAARRPQDRFCTIIFRGAEDTALAFDPEDRNAGDIVIYGVTPPSPPQK
jgi:uncharacterized iron-regulated protein